MLRSLNRLKHHSTLASSILLVGLITGCSKGSDSSNDLDHDHSHTEIESSGRLALYNADTTSIDVLNIDDQQILTSFALNGAAPRLYTSPEGRYAIAIQRSDNLVSIFDSGLYIEDHGDHLHEYDETPSDTGITLNGIAPTHYSVHEEHGVIFNDASDGNVSSIALLSDEILTANSAIQTLELTNRMHGVAKLINDKVFVTYRDLSVTDTTLPEQVERYSFDGNDFTLDTRYTEQCPALHGAGTNEDYLVFGCGDGVLSIDIQDANYPAVHSDNPASFTDGARIGSVYGHHEVTELIGTVGAHGSNTRHLYFITPTAAEVITAFDLPNDDEAITQGFTPSGDTFYVLAQDGVMHFFNTTDWSLADSIQAIEVAQLSLDSGEAPLVITSKATDTLYVLNPNAQEIYILDAEHAELVETIELDFTATSIAWLGLVEEHDH
ncbi:hypothetical protein ACFOEK_05185 [Litoribrevibacter euphylliae]|uniref:5-methyltetrahydrofolate--homocysteine methyltransferase n=1 Tax=Litoribrevibacter euphylliae TaxID=1834034 RepID=A0ABV7HCQ1_9GAMM